MALIDCPECKRQISTSAEACPGCGHPNRPGAVPVPVGPKCYSCPATATTKCQKCNTLSCVAHVEGVSLSLAAGPYELRCAECASSVNGWKVYYGVMTAIAVVGVLMVWMVLFSRMR